MKTGPVVTTYEGRALNHVVPRLGNGVAEQIVTFIRLYANRASLRGIPPVTLQGTRWDESWDDLAKIEGCTGNSGPSRAELLEGVLPYRCLQISLHTNTATIRGYPHPTTIEGTIAHEICHLRWPSLEHGPEFFARVLALLRGAVFPSHGVWRQVTKQIMAQTRTDAISWSKRLTNLA